MMGFGALLMEEIGLMVVYGLLIELSALKEMHV